jgi:hypothetical protein
MGAGAWGQLSAHEQALVAVAVLIDGAEATSVLAMDAKRAELLKAAAAAFSELELDARLPFLGTLLRRAIEDEG